jgi:hypothetical protein
MPIQAKTKRLQKISPLLVFWSVGLGMKFLLKIITQVGPKIFFVLSCHNIT